MKTGFTIHAAIFLLLAIGLFYANNSSAQDIPASVSKQLRTIVKNSDSVILYSAYSDMIQETQILKIISRHKHQTRLVLFIIKTNTNTAQLKHVRISKSGRRLNSDCGIDSLFSILNTNNLWHLDTNKLMENTFLDSNAHFVSIAGPTDGVDYKFGLMHGDVSIEINAYDPKIYKRMIPQLFNKERQAFSLCQDAFQKFWKSAFIDQQK